MKTKRKRLWMTGIAALFLVMLFGGCKDDNVEVVGICPEVISTIPLDGALNVPLNQIISVTFNEAMSPASFTQAAFTIEGVTVKKKSPEAGMKESSSAATVIVGTISCTGAVATFTPSSPLVINTSYTARIKATVKDLTGNALQVDYVWTFSTGAVIVPTVITTDPINLATNVALNKVISATFSQAMNSSTITTSFTLKNGAVAVLGTVGYSGTTATFTPTGGLTAGITYTAKITTGAQNVAGTPLAKDTTWTFSTGAALAPYIVTTDPQDLATNVALNKVVSADFSEAMKLSSLTTSFTLKEGIGLTPVAGVVSIVGTTAFFTPDANLLSDSTYTATITTGATNLSDVPIAKDSTWTFSTVPHKGPIAPDLKSISSYGSFGGNAGITNQGINTVINGNIGTTAAPTLVTGFHDAVNIYTETPLNVGFVTGSIYTNTPFPGTAASMALATQALSDATDAYIFISPAGTPGGTDPGAGELGSLTLAPGIYKSASGTFDITNGTLTLDAQGDVNAVWIFQAASSLTVGIAGPLGARSIVMINGGLPKNVYWYVGSSATINGAGGGTMVGTIIANSGVTFSTAGVATQTVLNGRAISLISSVTMVNTTINVPLP